MNTRAILGWAVFWGCILALILVPFFLFGARIETWTRSCLESSTITRGLVALLLGGLLALDILLPVPSSLVSTACGFMLGVPLGAMTSFLGMAVSSGLGYWLGARAGRAAAGGLVGTEQLDRMESLSARWGSWIVVVCRPVPVLAEASVIFAGMGRMPVLRFTVLCGLSNLAISVVYALVGAFASHVDSFLLAFVASIVVPGLAMLVARKKRAVCEPPGIL